MQRIAFLGEMQRIAFRFMLSLCVCVCVCLSGCLCVCVCMPRLWASGKQFGIQTSFLFELRGITPDIICKCVLHKSDFKFQDGGQNDVRESL